MANARWRISIIFVVLACCLGYLLTLPSLKLNLGTGVSFVVLLFCLWCLLVVPFLQSNIWRVISFVVLLFCLWCLLSPPSLVSEILAGLVCRISTILQVASLLALVFGLRYFLFASLKSKISILQVASLLALLVCLWYLLIAPSLKLKDATPEERFHNKWKALGDTQKDRLREVAKFDLEKKVYPEIQDRLTKINDWFINKMIFAGGLLGAFLLQLWWPFWSRDIPFEKRRGEAENIFKHLLTSAPVCAVLGLACVVSLFMDIHVRRSLIVIHQLGAWAAEYGTVALGGSYEQFPAWEQFIRMPAASSTQQSSPGTQQSSSNQQVANTAQPCGSGAQPSNSSQNSQPGMHNSLIDAVQTGNLSLMTLVVFAFYYLTFQTVCRSKQRLDEFNRLTYVLVIAILLVFLLMTHKTSGNFEFTGYGRMFWFSDFWGYFAAWSGITLLMVAWDFANTNTAKTLVTRVRQLLHLTPHRGSTPHGV